MIRNLVGVTLLESMLALAIVASIVLFGIKNYQQYKLQQEVQQIEYNVDMIFQAMKNFYYVNCPQTKLLDPANSPANPYPVDIQNTLGNGGYLSLTQWKPAVPLLVSSFGYSGYSAQLVQVTAGRGETGCAYFAAVPGSFSCSAYPNSVSNNVILWFAQVIVQFSNPANTLLYKGLVGADCAISSLPLTGDCGAVNVTTGKPAYLVWQRLPSFASPEMSSDLWMMMPYAKEFNLQYTVDPLSGAQNYLCGA
jgi:Tfp pilus assembly protein PilE